MRPVHVLSTLVLFVAMISAQTRQVSDAEVKRVHSSAILIDTHNDITSRTVDGYDIGEAKHDGHTNVTALKEGGVGAQFFAVYVAAEYVKGNHSANRTLQMIDTVRHDIVARYPNDFVLATTADDIEAHPPRGQDRGADGDRGRARDRGQPAPAARLLRAGDSLHDADACQHQQLGGFIGRHRRRESGAPQRPHRFRKASGARDEPAGHDGGHFACRRQDFLGRAGGEHGAHVRVAFVLPRAVPTFRAT